jgi:hypothetical protein
VKGGSRRSGQGHKERKLTSFRSAGVYRGVAVESGSRTQDSLQDCGRLTKHLTRGGKLFMEMLMQCQCCAWMATGRWNCSERLDSLLKPATFQSTFPTTASKLYCNLATSTTILARGSLEFFCRIRVQRPMERSQTPALPLIHRRTA